MKKSSDPPSLSRISMAPINVPLLLVSIILTTRLSDVSGTISVISQITNESVAEFNDAPASFVPDRVSYYGLRGYAIYANPANACSGIQPTPNTSQVVNWILVAKRFDCDFQTKIESAQNMGYSAIIIHNVGSNRTEPMIVRDPERLIIYAAFIGEYNGLLLRDNYSVTASSYEYYLSIEDDFSFSGYLLPFAIVVSVCFVVMLLFMVRLVWQQISRWLRERRRSRRRKLPTSVLKKLPITKWTKGDPYETCAVCLEDFIEQDKVRVLPCSHGFHSVCIDPWLTKNRRVCPICKRKVILAEERFNESDSDSDDETTPLLRAPTTSNPNPATSSSTFVQQGDSLFRVARRCRLHATRRFPRVDPNPDGPPQPQEQQEQDSSSDTSSVRSSTDCQSHRSLPVLALAEVHGSSSFEHNNELAPGTRAPFPSLQTQPSTFNSKSFHLGSGDDGNTSVMTGPSNSVSINLDSDDIEETRSYSSEPESVEIPAVHTTTGSANSNRDNRNNAIV